jgi:hypothetical protein
MKESQNISPLDALSCCLLERSISANTRHSEARMSVMVYAGSFRYPSPIIDRSAQLYSALYVGCGGGIERNL